MSWVVHYVYYPLTFRPLPKQQQYRFGSFSICFLCALPLFLCIDISWQRCSAVRTHAEAGLEVGVNILLMPKDPTVFFP